jgi:hypothetical protein
MTAMPTADGGPHMSASRVAHIVSSLGSPITYAAAVIAMRRRNRTTTRRRPPLQSTVGTSVAGTVECSGTTGGPYAPAPMVDYSGGGAVWWSSSAGTSQSWQRHR